MLASCILSDPFRSLRLLVNKYYSIPPVRLSSARTHEGLGVRVVVLPKQDVKSFDICRPSKLNHFSQLIHLIIGVVVVVLHGRRIIEGAPLRRDKGVEEEEHACEEGQHVASRLDGSKGERDTTKWSWQALHGYQMR